MDYRQYHPKSTITSAIMLLVALICTRAYAIKENENKLVEYETEANVTNVVDKRANLAIAVEHYEIPLRLLGVDMANRMDPDVKNALIFVKDGEPYVRWIINPEDNKWHILLERWLAKNHVSTEKHKYFTGYRTASRSYIIEPPEKNITFSVKVSTNYTGGQWKDKQQTAVDVFETRHVADHIMSQHKALPFEHIVILDEPAAFGIAAIDQGMVIRELNGLKNTNNIYVPGFAALHSKVGAEIAAKNGFKDPVAFWSKYYNKNLAKALAELAARTGVTLDSPHSQNFLIELDQHHKPTGRIVIRDLGDVKIFDSIVHSLGNRALLEDLSRDAVEARKIRMAVGIFQGTPMPEWMTKQDYDNWVADFVNEYKMELSKQTGVPVERLNGVLRQEGVHYFAMDFDLNDPEFLPYLRSLPAKKGVVPNYIDPYAKHSQDCFDSIKQFGAGLN